MEGLNVDVNKEITEIENHLSNELSFKIPSITPIQVNGTESPDNIATP